MIPLMGTSILLVGMLTVSIPIIIHLLHRQKTTPLLWGAMIFLKQSPLQMKRRKQIDHWLLMALRMAALALLAWLLARPLFNNAKYNPLKGDNSVDLAIVVDHSMSMGRHHGDKTLFEESREVVDRVVNSASPIVRGGDTVSIILAEHRPRKLTPAPIQVRDTPLMAQISMQMHQLSPGTTDCTIPEAIEAAREVIAHGPNMRKVVLVISDEQKTNWNIGDYAAWQRALGEDGTSGLEHHVEIHSYPLLADEDVSNITVGDIGIQPSIVGINRPVQLTANISNSGPKDIASLNIHLSVNGLETGPPQTIPSLAAKQSVTVRFDHTFTNAGSAWVKISTDVVDALAADNQSVAAMHVWQKLPVLVIDGQLTSTGGFKSSMFLNAAMQPVDPEKAATSLIQPNVISVSDSGSVKLDDYYAVIVNDVPQLPADLQNKLTSYVSAGHGLWVILGQRTNAQFISSLGVSHDNPQVLFTADLKRQTPRKEKEVSAIEIKDPNNPMVAIVTAGERNALAAAFTERWWSLTPKDPDAQVVLASSTGDPLVIERPLGSGRVVVWTTSADADWNNWPMMPNFVPLVNETIYHLTDAQTREHNSGNVEAGGSISWAGPGTPAIQKVDITLPDGQTDLGRKANYRDGHYEFTYPNAFMPGIYQLRFTPTEVPQPIFYGVGIDRRELDNTRLSPDDTQWLTKSSFLDKKDPRVEPSQLAYIITRIDEGMDIWKYIAGFVVLSMCLETYMTYRMAGLQKKIDVAGAGLVKA